MPADLLLNEDRRPATINYKTSDPADELAVCPCSKLGGGSGGGGGGKHLTIARGHSGQQQL